MASPGLVPTGISLELEASHQPQDTNASESNTKATGDRSIQQQSSEVNHQSQRSQFTRNTELLPSNDRVITEQSDKLTDPNEYSPIVLVPTEGQKQCIDSVVLEIARVFKEKIIDLVEPLCQ